MAADPIWSDASPDELEESKTLMEKRFLCHIYEFVFFPHEMAAMTNKLLHEHIGEHLQHIDADHSSLQISLECRSEMPWQARDFHASFPVRAYASCPLVADRHWPEGRLLWLLPSAIVHLVVARPQTTEK